VRAIGIDLGSKRIGVALSDSAGTLALPYEVVQRSGDRRRDHRRIAELVAEAEAEVVVVGLPYSLDGSLGPTARRYLAETEELRATIGVPVETYDERLTTVTAERSLREMQMTADARRRVVDKVAAAVMLQSWLDHRAGRPDPDRTTPPTSERPPSD
jgi:putative holliday junction resolvase